MASLLEMRTNVAAMVGLNASDDADMIDTYLNRGVVDILERTHCTVAVATADLSADDPDYTLPVSVVAIKYVYPQGGSRQLKPLGAWDLLERRLSSAIGSDVSYYALQGQNLLMVYPTPVDDTTLVIYYVPLPVDMTDDDDTPSTTSLGGIASQFHPGIELFAEWHLADLRDDQSAAQGERYRLLYEGDPSKRDPGFIGRMRGSLNRKSGSRLAPAHVGRARFVSSNESADSSPWS